MRDAAAGRTAAYALDGCELFERIGSDMIARQFLSMVAVMDALIGIKGEMARCETGLRARNCAETTRATGTGMVKLGAVHAALGEYDTLSALE
jgi:hypothetical protein